MLQTEFMHKKLTRAVLIPAVGCILPLTAAHADPVTYTFTGTGGGTITGGNGASSPFSGIFTFIFTGDTTNVDTSDSAGGFFSYNDIGGTFSEGGTTYTLAADNEVSISTDPAVPGFVPTIGFLNNDGFNGFGLGEQRSGIVRVADDRRPYLSSAKRAGTYSGLSSDRRLRARRRSGDACSDIGRHAHLHRRCYASCQSCSRAWQPDAGWDRVAGRGWNPSAEIATVVGRTSNRSERRAGD
jgi:hypothetical protein